MPAIQLAKLRQESAELAAVYEQPDEFIKGLIGILDKYADRAHRAGQAGEPPSLLATYNVPKPVIRQILIEISPQALSNPSLALEICDRLWGKPILELRWIAAAILGQVTPNYANEIFERLQEWYGQTNEDQVIDILVEQSMMRVRMEAPELLFDQAEEWLDDSNQESQLLGFRVLKTLVKNTGYENIPAYFRILTPFLRNLPTDLRNDLCDVFQELASYTPIETAAYLRQFLENTNNPDAAWITRQCMPYFAPQTQSSLRQLLRENSR